MRIATVGATKKANMVHAAAATNDATQETATAEMPAPAFATDDGLISTKKATKATKPAAARKPRAPTKTAAAKTLRVAKSKAAPKASPAEATQTAEPKNQAPGAAEAVVPLQQQPTPPASFRSKSPARSTQTVAEGNKNAPGPAPAHAPAPAAAKPTPAEQQQQQQQQRYERTADWVDSAADPAVSEEVVKNAATAEEVAEFRRKLFAGELEDDDEPEEKKIVYGDLVIDWGGVDPKADRRGSGVASSPQEATEYRERLEAKAEAGVREWDHDSLFGGSSSEEEEEEEEEEEAEAEKIADEESSDDENDDEESDEEEEEAGAAAGMDAAEEADLETLLERELLGDEEEEEEEEDDTDEVESVESEEE